MSMSRRVMSGWVLAALACAAACAEPGSGSERMTNPTPVDPTSNLFLWRVSPTEQTITRGQTATYTITIQTKTNINSRVRLSAGGATGATVTFSPELIPDTGRTSTMTVQTGPNTSLQRLEILVIAVEEGVGEPGGQFVSLTVTGSEPDFTLDVAPLAFELGTAEPRRIVAATLGSVNGFSADVTLSFSSPTPAIASELPKIGRVRVGSPAGVPFVVFYRPEPGMPAVSSPVRATITATGGNVTHTQEITITVAGATTPGVGPPR